MPRRTTKLVRACSSTWPSRRAGALRAAAPVAVLVALCVPASPAAGTDYFVALDGSDAAGSGAIDRPFATISKGLSLAQPGDRVVLRGGEYRLPGGEGTVRFPRPGAPGRPITLTAHEDEYVAILGSVRLTDWQPHAMRIYKCPAPEKHIRGLYEDGERLVHPRERGKRVDPPVSAITSPGRWTQQDGWVYLWARDSANPAEHRIEASQIVVVAADKAWVRVEGVHIFFGQPIGLNLCADHVVAENVEVAHVSNSVDNAYGAYISGCSFSALRNSTVHDSYYWGDHGSNSHVVSSIDCGDAGPNFVENCEIFNGGLGVGTKGAVRELVVVGNRIYDVLNGVVISGERSSGPGAGKHDRGHYLVYGNRISDCRNGVWFPGGHTTGNRVYNNLFERCGTAISARIIEAAPKETELANNVFLRNAIAIGLVGGRKGDDTLPLFHEAGFRSQRNIFFENVIDWHHPLDWSRELEMALAQVQSYRGYGWEAGSVCADPLLDEHGRPARTSPAIGAGLAVALPDYVGEPDGWHIGLAPRRQDEPQPEAGIALSIAGSDTTAAPGETLRLRARLTNEWQHKDVSLSGSAVLTYHFRYANVWHYDKQELHRITVQLPQRKLAPGESLDLTGLPGWKDPTNGKMGEAFHLRMDDQYWRSGWRLGATIRFVGEEQTRTAVQKLGGLVRSKEVLRVSCAEGPQTATDAT